MANLQPATLVSVDNLIYHCKVRLKWWLDGDLSQKTTLPETNIAPENGWLEYYFPFGMGYFQWRAVSFREGSFTRFLIHSSFGISFFFFYGL